MGIFILLLIVIPALEIWGLITLGNMIGGFNTFLLVILTGIAGAYLAKQQGLQVLQSANHRIQQGEAPGQALLDGISVLIGGVLLLTPGFFTDFVGILLLLPPTRKIFKHFLLLWIMKKIRSGSIHFYSNRRW